MTEKAKKKREPKRDAMGMTAAERRADEKEFNKRPGEAAKLKAIKAKNKATYGPGYAKRLREMTK